MLRSALENWTSASVLSHLVEAASRAAKKPIEDDLARPKFRESDRLVSTPHTVLLPSLASYGEGKAAGPHRADGFAVCGPRTHHAPHLLGVALDDGNDAYRRQKRISGRCPQQPGVGRRA
jgi:hypothetical protein